MKRHGWDQTRAHLAKTDYYKFLYLMKTYRETTFAPWSADLDLFWHEHILHTKKYHDDCMAVFGEIIHHDPTISENPRKERNIRADTVEAYRLEYSAARTLDTDDDWFSDGLKEAAESMGYYAVEAALFPPKDEERATAMTAALFPEARTSVPQYPHKKESDYDHGASFVPSSSNASAISHSHNHHSPGHSSHGHTTSHDTGSSHSTHSCGGHSCGGHHG